MAPRKRTTRTTRQQHNDAKMAKLDAFLQDFDSEVETRVKRMKEKSNQMLKDLDNSYNMLLIKIPKAVRQMNWLELYKSEKSTVADTTKREEEAAIVDSVMAEDHAVLLKSVKKSSKKNVSSKSSSEEENTVASSTRKGRPAKKPPTTSKRAKALSVSRQNAPIRRSSRKPLTTPARNVLDSSVMGATPLITPRFDPRLPKTPAVRIPRHKERVYSISVNGSPIAAGNEDIIINIPSSDGESIQLLASQINTVDLTQLDQTAQRSIRLLQNRLTTLCGIAE